MSCPSLLSLSVSIWCVSFSLRRSLVAGVVSAFGVAVVLVLIVLSMSIFDVVSVSVLVSSPAK